MVFMPNATFEKSSDPPILPSLLIGAILGFFSGMIGIGGGIILSPVLILFHWATIKESAAASALFILLNSLSGLSALLMTGLHYDRHMIAWIIAGILGGLAGSYFGSVKLRQGFLKYVLAGILLLASIKLFIY
jgi:uncharacterized membrane protein YfcA